MQDTRNEHGEYSSIFLINFEQLLYPQAYYFIIPDFQASQ